MAPSYPRPGPKPAPQAINGMQVHAQYLPDNENAPDGPKSWRHEVIGAPRRDDWLADAARAAYADGNTSSPPYWKVKARDLGNGHREAVVCKVYPEHTTKLLDLMFDAPKERGAGDREANAARAARRAKQQCRLVCKAMAVNSLWTLTYRENVQDREVVMAHLKAFARRVRRILGSQWQYCAVLERQARGAYHVHLATHALPRMLVSSDQGNAAMVKSWDVMREVWRSITKEAGGNFDESKSTNLRSSAAISRYISKYVAKSFEEDALLNKKRFTHSEGVAVPDAEVARFPADTPLGELVQLAYAAVGQRVTATWLCLEREVFYVETDDSLGAVARRRPGKQKPPAGGGLSVTPS